MRLTCSKDIRTYGVVTLNEECGFIQWVPNTVPVRPVLTKYYSARNVQLWVGFSNLRSPRNIDRK